jgi:hypothetical protein
MTTSSKAIVSRGAQQQKKPGTGSVPGFFILSSSLLFVVGVPGFNIFMQILLAECGDDPCVTALGMDHKTVRNELAIALHHVVPAFFKQCTVVIKADPKIGRFPIQVA